MFFRPVSYEQETQHMTQQKPSSNQDLIAQIQQAIQQQSALQQQLLALQQKAKQQGLTPSDQLEMQVLSDHLNQLSEISAQIAKSSTQTRDSITKQM
jgi:hypothetical protein